MNISAPSLPPSAVATLLAARPAVAGQGAHLANLLTRASDDQAKSEAAISSGRTDVYL